MNTRPYDAAHRSDRLPAGDLGQACAVLDESIDEPVELGRAYYDRANVCASEGDVGGAIAAYEAAATLAPGFAEALSNLGGMYVQSGRYDDALRAYEAALRANPELAPVYCNLATVLIELERFDEAIAALETALRLAPDLYQAHANLCQAYRRSGRDREALAPALVATGLRPDRDAFLSLSAAASKLDELDIALEAARRVIELDPACAEAHANLGWIHHLTGRFAEAMAACEAAIALRPDLALAHVNLASSLLICGDFARGWNELVWTWPISEQRTLGSRPELAKLWDGTRFTGRDLLITFDRDFADAIQMIRYVPAVKARGGRVILEVKGPLVALFADLPGVDELHLCSDAAILADEVDLQIPLLGLPRALATDLRSIPAPIPYLRAHPERVERWRGRLESRGRLRVGLAWSDNSAAANRRRSAALEDFAVLGEIEDIAWFGLQKGGGEDRHSCGMLMLDPLGEQIGDFADAAAIVAQLDLVIAVDTPVAHLAGALGKPVWTLLPFTPDWRWLLERGDSPWYPSMRLFRQPAAGDWLSVFAEVARELSIAAAGG